MKLKVETKEVKADPEKGTPAGILIKLSGLTKQKNSEVLAGAKNLEGAEKPKPEVEVTKEVELLLSGNGQELCLTQGSKQILGIN